MNSIRIDWAPSNDFTAFNTGSINLVAPHLQALITDVRIACIQGLDKDDFDLFTKDKQIRVPSTEHAHGNGTFRVFEGMEKGLVYELRLREDAKEGIKKAYIPYRYLGSDGHVNHAMLNRLSRAFYGRVWESDRVRTPPGPLLPAFKAAFAESAGSAAVAASNQATWFAR